MDERIWYKVHRFFEYYDDIIGNYDSVTFYLKDDYKKDDHKCTLKMSPRGIEIRGYPFGLPYTGMNLVKCNMEKDQIELLSDPRITLGEDAVIDNFDYISITIKYNKESNGFEIIWGLMDHRSHPIPVEHVEYGDGHAYKIEPAEELGPDEVGEEDIDIIYPMKFGPINPEPKKVKFIDF